MTQSLHHLDRFDFRIATHGSHASSRSDAILILHDSIDLAAHHTGHDKSVSQDPSHRFLGLDQLENAETFFIVSIEIAGVREGPPVTIAELVEQQRAILRRLEIETLYAAIGYSTGGLQVLDWLARYPGEIQRAAIVGAAAHISPHARLAHSITRELLTHATHGSPASRAALNIGRAIGALLNTSPDRPGYGLIHNAVDADIVTAELIKTSPPFDAQTYDALSRAIDSYDFAQSWGQGDLRRACQNIAAKIGIIGFTGDGLFPATAAKVLFQAMLLAGANVSFNEIFTRHGHTTPVIEPTQLFSALTDLLDIDSGDEWSPPLYDI